MQSFFSLYMVAFVILFSGAEISTHSHEAEDWELVKNKNEIKIFVKKKAKDFDALRVEAKIYTNLSKFTNYLNVAKYYPDWLYSCREAGEIRKDNDTLEYYTITDMPFPFYDRILTVRSTQQIDHKRYESNSVGIPPLEENPKLVPVPFFKSQWIVEEVLPSVLFIKYSVQMDPGGNIPIWLSDLAIDIGPYNTMFALKEIVEGF